MEELNYEVIRSSRRSIGLQLRQDGSLIVRCPPRMPEREVRAFVEEHRNWIEKHRAQLAAQPKLESLTVPEVRALAQKAAQILPERCAHFAPLVGVNYGRITIRSQHGRWGSCSAKGNLNFNCLLMLCPDEVADYVVVHELCHRKEMNHSARFWALVEQILPDYKIRRKWLKENGGTLIARLPSTQKAEK